MFTQCNHQTIRLWDDNYDVMQLNTFDINFKFISENTFANVNIVFRNVFSPLCLAEWFQSHMKPKMICQMGLIPVDVESFSKNTLCLFLFSIGKGQYKK